MAKRLKMRITDGSKHVEFEADITAVTHQIVNGDGEILPPNVLVEYENHWLKLSEYPDAPWWDRSVKRYQ